MHFETGSIVSCDICPQVRLEVNPNESAVKSKWDVASRGVETTLKDRQNNSLCTSQQPNFLEIK